MESTDDSSRTNLIVNYIPQTVSDGEFYALFAAVGTVKSSKIIRDKATNYSHGYGFVDFSTHAEAADAVEKLNGLQLQHKRIKVALARPPGENTKNTNLYITGIPPNMAKETLEEVFSPYGTVVQAKVLTKPDKTAKGDGFVLFETKEIAQAAMEALDGQTLPGGVKPMTIKFALENKRNKAAMGDPMAIGGFGGKFPPPPPPVGRGRGGAVFGGPMRTRGVPNRFNPMTPPVGTRGRGGRGAGGWRGGVSNGNGYGDGHAMGGFYGADLGYADPSYVGGEETYSADEYYDDGSGAYQQDSGYQGYYDTMGYPGYGATAPSTGVHGGYGRGAAAFRGGARGGAAANNYGAPPGTGIALHVYNIGPSATQDDVMNIFSHYGSVVKVDVIMDFEKKVSKNYAFVHMSTEDEAETAIAALHERYTMRPGHPLQVRFHKPRA